MRLVNITRSIRRWSSWQDANYAANVLSGRQLRADHTTRPIGAVIARREPMQRAG
jgi:hypothetical protein